MVNIELQGLVLISHSNQRNREKKTTTVYAPIQQDSFLDQQFFTAIAVFFLEVLGQTEHCADIMNCNRPLLKLESPAFPIWARSPMLLSRRITQRRHSKLLKHSTKRSSRVIPSRGWTPAGKSVCTVFERPIPRAPST
ncbi:hypothetical protein CDAR_422931 [Caerostris darwini]|uniref:Uncharacterized protein n=1 Tax=Caerostris darwini TaxID=1538125 RepID=A0AAV4TBL7_9ARAC|nr:hypothetical protein CDAR_422931 [Caerostris darwini]